MSGLPPAGGSVAAQVAPILTLAESISMESLDYPLYNKKTESAMKKPNIHLNELSYFLKVLEAKVRFDPQLQEGLPI